MGKKAQVTMPVTQFVQEHKNLLHILRKGTKAERLAEAKDQAKELKSYTGGIGLYNPTAMYTRGLEKSISDLIKTKYAQQLGIDATSDAPTKSYNGHEWYLEARPINDAYGAPPGYWLRRDLTPEAVEAYNLRFQVLAQFPDGTLRLYEAPMSKRGLASMYVDTDARRDLRQAWDAWEAAEKVKAEEKVRAEAPARANYEAWKGTLQAEQDRKNAAAAAGGERAVFVAKYGMSPEALKEAFDRNDMAFLDKVAADSGTPTNYDPMFQDMTRALEEVVGSGKPPEERRQFPEQFSAPLRKLLDEVSFGPPDVMGSNGDHKVMYAADYDLLEFVPLHGKATVRAFQKKVARLASKVCVTDIKCGEVSDWNLLQGKTYDQKKEWDHLHRLWREKVITDKEMKMGMKVLKPTLTPADRVAARKLLRFGVLRWTPAEVAAGVKMNRLNKPVRLEDAMTSKGITKVDVLAWVKDRYVEVSNIILWTGRSGKPYAHIPELLQALREDIAYYVHDGNYFKAAKRMLSIAKNRKEVAQQEKLLAILNSPLGHISTVVSDLKVLKEFPTCVAEKKREQLDALRDDMAKLYYPEFNASKSPAKLLPALEGKLQEEARKKLEEAGFLPLKGLYKAGKE